ncbi:hypothetical protein [Roseiconus lacunae]|uniref:Wadjet protein JetD C-terminal domain-containing protein n=1 Tax=Roseiconus lacunae TaxID=2605694 RepID=A0ABT7PFJ9_9BACT|nr:hypothetical protein [Roseiconus lacunae]MDM4015270.1 hypothetical protein [Roseiconus lacunae]
MDRKTLLSRLDSIGWKTVLPEDSLDRLCDLGLRGDSYELAVIAGELAIECQPITLRGLFYRVVSTGFFPSTAKKYYDKLQRLLSSLRDAGWIPYDWIVDNLRATIKPSSWSGLEDFTDTVRGAYRKDFWASLPNYVHIFVEKDAMTGVIEPVTRELDVSLSPVRGYVSDSYAWTVGSEFRDIDKPIKCFYIGDFDPSGFDLERSLREKIEKHSGKPVLDNEPIDEHLFSRGAVKAGDILQDEYKREHGLNVITWERIALVEEDFGNHQLIELDVKLTDTRSKSFIEEHGTRCAEVDALNPNEIRRRVRDSIMQYVPNDQWERLREIEQLERETWESTLGQFAGGDQ